MATGLTYGVQEGKYSFADFVWRCAKQFGALVHMRDDPMDKRPKKRETDPYYFELLKESEKELARLKSLTPKHLEKETDKYNEKREREYQEALAKQKLISARYNDMLNKVKAWEPPTPDHAGLRSFMVDQLLQSIQFDCSYAPEKPKKVTPEELLAFKLENARSNVEWYTKQCKQHDDRDDSANQWIEALEKSVPIPESMK